jgi:polyphosphate kinase 2 (PPK2 family)
LQRFWEKLPDPGLIVVFDRSWYGRVLVERVEGLASKRRIEADFSDGFSTLTGSSGHQTIGMPE